MWPFSPSIVRALFNGIPLDEEPTIKKELRGEEKRWRSMVDDVCEGNQDLTDIRNAISEMRHRRKKEFRNQQTASGGSTSAPSSPIATSEGIQNAQVVSTPLVESPRPLSPTPLVSIPPQASLPVVPQEVATHPRSESLQSPSPIRSTLITHETGVPGPRPAATTAPASTPPEADTRPLSPAVRPAICNPHIPGPIGRCSDLCQEIAMITLVISGKPSSPTLQPGFEPSQMKSVQAAIASRANEKDLMKFCPSRCEGQPRLDLMQWMLDNQADWPSNPSAAVVHAQIRQRLRKLIQQFASQSGRLPSSLYLEGVTCGDLNSQFGGSFADITVGQYRSQQVALKRLRLFQNTSTEDAEKLKKRLHHELLVWKNLRNPNILPMLGIDQTINPRNPSMVLPWMNKGSVRFYLKNRTEDDQFDFEALEVIVRKWDNVLVDGDDNIRLADFGLAVLIQQAQGSIGYGSTRGGNPRWLSPELIEPEQFPGQDQSRRPTKASDIYSFACVCIELYTKQEPFGGQFVDGQITRQVMAGTRPSRPTFLGREGKVMDDTLWSLLTRCWAHNPEGRPTADLLVEKISLWLSQYP
ncbi:hypothetical protein NLI96_g5252 [Meripilus lineatus]|uniref:Protein kinase domain-containing protein n=1 Tax=Meripilus lineatus TaxID=2056292 RepID=A0AAD5YJ56_9APHY|nr:hypothetical protein NLI96_g5252 [Physisporinus lineatus]